MKGKREKKGDESRMCEEEVEEGKKWKETVKGEEI